MDIAQKIEDDLHKAIKEGDKEHLEVLRMLKTALTFKEKERGEKPNQEEVIAVLQTEQKKRAEAALEYKKGQREDLAQKEEKEVEIIAKYLPEEMSDEEIKKTVLETKTEVGAYTKEDFGKVMGAVMGKLKGRAHGARVKQIVEQSLEKK